MCLAFTLKDSRPVLKEDVITAQSEPPAHFKTGQSISKPAGPFQGWPVHFESSQLDGFQTDSFLLVPNISSQSCACELTFASSIVSSWLLASTCRVNYSLHVRNSLTMRSTGQTDLFRQSLEKSSSTAAVAFANPVLLLRHYFFLQTTKSVQRLVFLCVSQSWPPSSCCCESGWPVMKPADWL